MADSPASNEVLPVKHYSEVYNGKWYALLVISPQGTPIWVSIPREKFGKGKQYFYDSEKKTLALPSGSGYDARTVDFAMGLKMLTVGKA